MLHQILSSFNKYPDKTSFCIGEKNYSYRQLETITTSIVEEIKHSGWEGKIVAVQAQDSIYTYASILALWFTRNAYLPLHPKNKLQKNIDLLCNAGVDVVISNNAEVNDAYHEAKLTIVEPAKLPKHEGGLRLPESMDEKDLMYVLFTSGSTGKPKGVPINRKNLDAFVESFFKMGYSINSNDRFMQMFDLTFDVSVQSYVLPLCVGAGIYTVPENEIKYLYALRLLKVKRITITKMVSSTLNFLQSYFEKIHLPDLKYSLFSGEALPVDLVEKWKRCVPNAQIHNYYGPTEATVDCTFYPCGNKSYNGIISIGKTFGNSQHIVIDERAEPVNQGKKGELCITGDQVFSGYLNRDDLSNNAFISFQNNNYYRTGDLVFEDEEGDLMFCGRIDHQVQVQGYRVEPGEIEFVASTHDPNSTFVAVAKTNQFGNNEIHLFGTNGNWASTALMAELKNNLPFYMIPVAIHQIDKLPMNANGKTDRNALIQMLQ